MATLSGTAAGTLGEAGNIIHNNRIVDFAATLSELNPIMRHALIVPATDAFNNYHVQQLSDPTVGWRKVNAGVAASQGLTKPINEPVLMAESFSDVDERLVENSPNPDRLRMSYGRRHVMAMLKEFEDKFFYGDNATNPEQPNGTASRYNDPATQSNVTDNGDSGAGASASFWIFDWSEEQGIFLAHSPGSPLGLDRVDQGKQRVTDGSSNPYYVYEEQFKLSFALNVADDRGVQRIGSIDPVFGQANDLDANNIIIASGNMLDSRKAGYCNRDIWKQVTLEANAKSNAYFLAESPWGDGFVPQVLDVAIYRAEGLNSTEDAI